MLYPLGKWNCMMLCKRKTVGWEKRISRHETSKMGREIENEDESKKR